MEPRAAAHALAEIATLLELRGAEPFKTRAFATAARVVQALPVDDIGPLVRSREITRYRGIGPVTLGVLDDLVTTGDSEYLDLLRETTPEGLIEMLRIPGLGPARIHKLHVGLGVDTVQELEEAALDGRLASLPGFGQKTAARILRGIASLRESTGQMLFSLADALARRLRDAVERRPGVARVEIAGSLRRRMEVVRDIDLVVVCDDEPARVAADLATLGGVREVIGGGGPSIAVRFQNGIRVELHCVRPDRFPVAIWRATGSHDHVAAMERVARERGFSFAHDQLLDAEGHPIRLTSEEELYEAVGLEWIPPELREDQGEVAAARTRTLPRLVETSDLRGVLHCHSNYSDGTTTIEQMALAARARGWSYLGVTDHSQSAFYAGGLTRDAILRQHEEIDRVNARVDGVRVLKGIEADILADGRVDYGADLLDHFDYVVGSVHSRFGMSEAQMTERILRALEDPHLTILGHPTGRLLLTREPYAVNLPAVIERAAELRVAIELNCDPHRLDLDWRWLRMARERGAQVEIGPDAHSPEGLANVDLGIGIARKACLEATDVLNARDVEGVLAFARARRLGAAVAP